MSRKPSPGELEFYPHLPNWGDGYADGYLKGLRQGDAEVEILWAEIVRLRGLLHCFDASITSLAEVFLILYPGSELQVNVRALETGEPRNFLQGTKLP